MKALVLFLATAASLSANAGLESHYGKVKSRGFTHTCSLTNRSGSTLDFKYVVFTFEGHGDSNDYDVQERIDKRVQPGDSVSASVSQSTATAARYCRFLAR